MAKTDKEKAVARFNNGCKSLRYAILAMKAGKFTEGELAINQAAREAVGALEWGIKLYLRGERRQCMTDDDVSQLKQPNFKTLVELLERYADPPITNQLASAYLEHRTQSRNPAEHSPSTPSVEAVREAVLDTRRFFILYLGAKDEELESIDVEARDDWFENERLAYLKVVQERNEFLDLAGISPRIGNRIIRIRMNDLFISLQAVEGVPMLEYFAEDSLENDELNANVEITAKSRSVLLPATGDINGIPSSPVSMAMLNLAEMLQHPRLVVLGDPGGGKTTSARFIAYSIAAESFAQIGETLKGFVPIAVRASEFAACLPLDPTLSIHSYVCEKISQRFGALFSEALVRQRVLLIVDGLDEVADPKQRLASKRKIEEFASEFSANRLLVTSRVIGYRQVRLLGDFHEVRLAPLDRSQVIAFLEGWHRAVEAESGGKSAERDAPRRARELWKAIRANPGTLKLGTNLLLLTIIALANWRGTRLPNRRVDLYQIATETLLENWPLSQRGQDLDAHDTLALLEPVAYQMFRVGKSNAISEDELRPLLERQICEVQGSTAAAARGLAREILKQIEEFTGFFVERGRDTYGRSVYGFLHMTFAEYLAGRHLAALWSDDAGILREVAHDPRWREVLLLASGHVATWNVAQATRLVTDILNLGSDYEPHVHRDLLLAAEMLSANTRVTRGLLNQIVAELISVMSCPGLRDFRRECRRSITSIAKVFPLGDVGKLLDPTPTDDQTATVEKTILSAGIQQNADGDRALVAALCDPSMSDSDKWELESALDAYGSEDDGRGDVLVIMEGGVLRSAGTISGSTRRRLERVVPVTSPMAADRSSLDCPILIMQMSDLTDLSPEALAEELLFRRSSGNTLLRLAMEFAGRVQRESTAQALFEIALRATEPSAKRTAALQLCSMLWRHEPGESAHKLIAMAKRIEGALVNSLDDALILAFVKVQGLFYRMSGEFEAWIKLVRGLAGQDSALVRELGVELISDAYRRRRFGSDQFESFVQDSAQVVWLLRELTTGPATGVNSDAALAFVETALFEALSEAERRDLVVAMTDGIARSDEGEEMARLLVGCLVMLSGIQDDDLVAEGMLAMNGVSAKLEKAQLDDAGPIRLLSHPARFERKLSTAASELSASRFEEFIRSGEPLLRRTAARLWRGAASKSCLSGMEAVELAGGDTSVEAAILAALPPMLSSEPEVIVHCLGLLKSEDHRLSGAAADVLSSQQQSDVKLSILTEVSALVEENQRNEAALRVLWRLTDSTDDAV